MDLTKLVEDNMLRMVETGVIDKMVETSIRDCVSNVITDAFGSYSPLSKQLKEVVKEKLQVNFERLNLEGYNQTILNLVQSELDRAVTEIGVASMKKSLDTMLQGAAPDCTLSELVEEMKVHERGNVESDKVSLYVEPGNILTFIYLDPEEDVDSYDCRYHIAVAKDGRLSSVSLKGRSFDNNLILGGLYGVEATLFRMYTMRGKLEVDSEVDIYYPEAEQFE